MAQIIREVSIDVAKSNIFQAIIAKQHDSNSRFLKATITNQGKKINIENSCVVTINGERKDGEAKAFKGSVNEDGTVTVPLTNWLLGLDGKVKCDISIVDAEGRKLTTTKFTLLVEAAAYDGSEISEDEDAELLISILAECAGAKEAAGNAEQTKNKGVAGGYAGLDEDECIPDKNNIRAFKAIKERVLETDLFDIQKETVLPKNLVPSNVSLVAKNGVTVTLVDNIVTVVGTWSATWNDSIKLGLNIPSGGGNYYLQIWDISGDTSGLAGGSLFVNNALRGAAYNNAANGGYCRCETSEGDTVDGAIILKPGFSGTAIFKLTLATEKLTAYEESFEPYEKVTLKEIKNEFLSDETKATGNLLYGKKWAVCGDSFTNGDFNNSLDTNYTIEDGRYAGKNKVYGYLIGNRNNMEIQHLAVGGRTMAMPADGSFTNAFSNEMYKTIDADVDYITLYFGINDSHHRPKATGSDGEDTTGIIELGTIDDTDNSTFYGAWNVVLEYLITNYPNAHIGIIVSNGCETHDYPTAEIELANKWGIPYIDLNGDERTPTMLRSTNPNKSSIAKNARLQAWAVNPSLNKHPNAKAHEYESVFIENWLRTL